MEAQTDVKTIEYTVNGETQATESRTLIANEILKNAGFDPATNYLVEIRGHHKESYQDRGAEEIHLHPHIRFLAISLAPTPVSAAV